MVGLDLLEDTVASAGSFNSLFTTAESGIDLASGESPLMTLVLRGPMKGIRTVLFLLGCSPVFGFAQNSKQCVADLQHLTLPAYAQIQYGDDNGETPLVYLFSEDGDDIYSAIPSNARNYVEHLYSNGISFIVVYQDERHDRKPFTT